MSKTLSTRFTELNIPKSGSFYVGGLDYARRLNITSFSGSIFDLKIEAFDDFKTCWKTANNVFKVGEWIDLFHGKG